MPPDIFPRGRLIVGELAGQLRPLGLHPPSDVEVSDASVARWLLRRRRCDVVEAPKDQPIKGRLDAIQDHVACTLKGCLHLEGMEGLGGECSFGYGAARIDGAAKASARGDVYRHLLNRSLHVKPLPGNLILSAHTDPQALICFVLSVPHPCVDVDVRPGLLRHAAHRDNGELLCTESLVPRRELVHCDRPNARIGVGEMADVRHVGTVALDVVGKGRNFCLDRAAAELSRDRHTLELGVVAQSSHERLDEDQPERARAW